MGQRCRQTVKHDVDFVRQQRRHARPRALVRHMHDANAGCEIEQLARHVDAGAIAAGSKVQLARLAFRQRHQFLHRFDRQRRMRDQHIGRRSNQRHMRKVPHRVIRHGLHQIGHDGQWAGETEQERVAIGRGLSHDVGADQSGGAGAIINDDLPAEQFGQRRRHHACNDIIRSARRRRRDHADRTLRIGRGLYRRGQTQQHKGCTDKLAHVSPPAL